MKFELNFEEGCLMPEYINFKKPRYIRRKFKLIKKLPEIFEKGNDVVYSINQLKILN